ncbi:MAG: hypothetical protein RL681_529 [Candidatus Parcubacteria bacterium]|jgi:hypothetical protein
MAVTPELATYVEQARKNGLADIAIQEALLQAGWDPALVREAVGLGAPVVPATSAAPNVPENPVARSVVSPIARFGSTVNSGVAPAKQVNFTQGPSRVGIAEKINTVAPVEQKTSRRGTLKYVVIGSIAVIAVAGVAFAGYTYVQRSGGLFAHPPYTEDDFLSGLFKKNSQINTASYTLSATFDTSARDADAKPFTVQPSNEGKLREQYQNDAQRGQDASTLLEILIGNHVNLPYPPYPASLEKLQADVTAKERGSYSYYTNRISITDPVTKRGYTYAVTESGKNFALKVTFEAPGSIQYIRRSYGYSATSTPISGQVVTFTRASQMYLYLPSEPPKPFLVQLGEGLRMLTPDMKATLGVGAATDFSQSSSSDWKFNLNAKGDFGDLSYAVDADAMKANGIYYFRINKIPSIIAGSLAALKGQWISVDPNAPTSTSASSPYGYMYSPLSYLQTELPDAEKSYKENRAQTADLVQKMMAFADEEHLVIFKDDPKKEDVDGRPLYRYNLKISKTAILPFYKKLVAEAGKNKNFDALSELANDPGLVEYLESKEFDDVFDYYDRNVNLVVWIDQDGFIGAVQYSLRIVPPDTATQLAGKQANLVFKATLSDVNKPLAIDAPPDATPIKKIIETTMKNEYGYDPGSAAAARTALAAVGNAAEVASSRGESGTKAYGLAKCAKVTNTLFGNDAVYTAIQNATDGDASKATCVSAKTGTVVDKYAVSVPLDDLPGYSWCIDSSGASKQITGTITGSSCK